MNENAATAKYVIKVCNGNTCHVRQSKRIYNAIRKKLGLSAEESKTADGKFELVEYPHSPAVAILEGLEFEEHEFTLHPGDRIFVYTDGVPEATNSADELYGDDRMLDALNFGLDVPPKVLLADVKSSIDEFVAGAEQFDDITMLCFDFNGKQDEGEKDE